MKRLTPSVKTTYNMAIAHVMHLLYYILNYEAQRCAGIYSTVSSRLPFSITPNHTSELYANGEFPMKRRLICTRIVLKDHVPHWKIEFCLYLFEIWTFNNNLQATPHSKLLKFDRVIEFWGRSYSPCHTVGISIKIKSRKCLIMKYPDNQVRQNKFCQQRDQNIVQRFYIGLCHADCQQNFLIFMPGLSYIFY